MYAHTQTHTHIHTRTHALGLTLLPFARVQMVTGSYYPAKVVAFEGNDSVRVLFTEYDDEDVVKVRYYVFLAALYSFPPRSFPRLGT